MGSSPQMQPLENYFESIPGLGDALKTAFHGNSGGGINFPSLNRFGDNDGAGQAIPKPSMWPGAGETASPHPSIPATDPSSMGGGVGSPVVAPTPSLSGAAQPASSSIGSWGGNWNDGGFGPSSQQNILSKLLMQHNPSLGES